MILKRIRLEAAIFIAAFSLLLLAGCSGANADSGQRDGKFNEVGQACPASLETKAGSSTGNSESAAQSTPAASKSAVQSSPEAKPIKIKLPADKFPCLNSKNSLQLSQITGKPVILTLWATWCAPCRAEVPVFNQLVTKHGDKVTVIGVNTADAVGPAQRYIEASGMAYPSVSDPERKVLKASKSAALPMSLFIDSAGQTLHIERAAIDEYSELQNLTEQHLKVAIT